MNGKLTVEELDILQFGRVLHERPCTCHPMSVKFISEVKRDELGNRLLALAENMRRSMDQGHDWRIGVNEEMIEDIQTAAICVLTTGITSPDRPTPPQET